MNATTRAAELHEQVAEATRQMGIHPIGSPVWSTWMAKCGEARRELRQMEENR